ncbi:MAG: helix-turn-helix transcriptional regulator [Dehalococcoidia bacterium]
MDKDDVPATKSSGNVFLDLGFGEAEAAGKLAKAKLILELKRAMRARDLTQRQAAKLCGDPRVKPGDQPTLSKVLSGRMEAVTIDLLARWLNALGRTVEIKVTTARKGPARLVVNA